jgi:hypothetical protein
VALTVNEYKRELNRELKKVSTFLVPRVHLTRHFEVHTDTLPVSSFSILTAIGVSLFNQHPEFPGAICKKIGVPQGDDDNAHIFDVTVEYDDDFEGMDKEKPTDNNPLNRPVVVQGGFNEHDEIIYQDLDNNPIKNSAGDPFDPPPTRKAGALRFSMTKNYPTLNLGILRAYKNAINSDAWFGQAQYTARIANVSFSRVIEEVQNGENDHQTWVYWPYTFEFEVAEPDVGDGTWHMVLLDQGYRHTQAGDPLPIRNTDGTPVTQPSLLNGSGALSTTPHFLTFNIYRALPFAALGLL